MEPLTFRIGAVVEASPVAFGRAFADQAPAGTVYRGMVVGRDEDDDNGVAEGRRVWRVLYDDDDTVWPTAQEHLTPVRARPEEVARAQRLDCARAQPEPKKAKKRTTLATPPAPKPAATARPADLARFRVGAGAASAAPRPAARAPAAVDGASPARRPAWALGSVDPSDSSRPNASANEAGAAVSRWAAVQAAARRAPSPAFDAPPAKKAYKRARRVDAGAGAPHQRRLFALLDLDGTLFHMLPEAEVPTNLEAICEGVVPLDAPVPGPAAAATPARHVLCVRKGTRALLAALRACGATVRVVTANLMGVEAVAALAAHEAATEASTGDALQGWRGALDVTVVVDRAPGSKRLPDDVAAALRAQRTARCVILDDNPTAWEAYAARYVWVVPQYDVRRPLSSQALEEEVTLLPRLSARCRDLFAKADRPRANSQNGPTPRGGPPRPRSNSGDAAPTAGDQSRRGSSPRDGTRTVSARGVVRASARGVCAPAQAEAAAARGDAAAASSAAPSKSRRAATPHAAGARAGGRRPGRSLRRGAPTAGAGGAAGDSSAKRNDATRELGAGRRALAGPTRGRLMRNWPPKERLSAPDMLRFINLVCINFT